MLSGKDLYGTCTPAQWVADLDVSSSGYLVQAHNMTFATSHLAAIRGFGILSLSNEM